MEIVLLIGAQPYRLSESDARWLEERIRSTLGVQRGLHVPSVPGTHGRRDPHNHAVPA